MKYMLLMVGDEAAQAAAAAHADDEEPCWLPWHTEMTGRGVGLLEGARLQPESTATTVGVTDGDVLLSDGPFAETKEQILGYHVIDVADLDEAVYVASRHPTITEGGRIEIRPILAD
jgi:hypothetical protein